jgi:hypothetical protein
VGTVGEESPTVRDLSVPRTRGEGKTPDEVEFTVRVVDAGDRAPLPGAVVVPFAVRDGVRFTLPDLRAGDAGTATARGIAAPRYRFMVWTQAGKVVRGPVEVEVDVVRSRAEATVSLGAPAAAK